MIYTARELRDILSKYDDNSPVVLEVDSSATLSTIGEDLYDFSVESVIYHSYGAHGAEVKCTEIRLSLINHNSK
jgi:hypothetical protein